MTGLVGMARNTGIDIAGGAAVRIHSRHRRGRVGSGVAKMSFIKETNKINNIIPFNCKFNHNNR